VGKPFPDMFEKNAQNHQIGFFVPSEMSKKNNWTIIFHLQRKQDLKNDKQHIKIQPPRFHVMRFASKNISCILSTNSKLNGHVQEVIVAL